MTHAKWSVGRLVIGILCIVLFVFITFQSCAAGLSNSMASNGETSGSFGLITGIFYLVAGIVGIATHNAVGKAGPIVCCVLLWLCFFFSRIGAGSYTDLLIWGIVAFAFGCVYLFAAMHTKKEFIICGVVAAVYLVAGLL